MTRSIPLLSLLLLLATGAGAQQPAGSAIHATFDCKAQKTIAAVFTQADGGNVRLTLSDGRKLTLPQAASADGARYANADESIVFWNKGDTAFIQEGGKTTYDGCVQKGR